VLAVLLVNLRTNRLAAALAGKGGKCKRAETYRVEGEVNVFSFTQNLTISRKYKKLCEEMDGLTISSAKRAR
jgi:hypothetical protein